MQLILRQRFTNVAMFCWSHGKLSLCNFNSGQEVSFDSLSQGMGMLREELQMTKREFLVLLWYVIVENKSDSPAYERAVENIVHKRLLAD